MKIFVLLVVDLRSFVQTATVVRDNLGRGGGGCVVKLSEGSVAMKGREGGLWAVLLASCSIGMPSKLHAAAMSSHFYPLDVEELLALPSFSCVLSCIKLF